MSEEIRNRVFELACITPYKEEEIQRFIDFSGLNIEEVETILLLATPICSSIENLIKFLEKPQNTATGKLLKAWTEMRK